MPNPFASQRSLIVAISSVLALSLHAGPAAAISVTGWDCITDNLAADCTIGASQLSGSLVSENGNALLTITMTGPEDAVVAQVVIESAFVADIAFVGNSGAGLVVFTADDTPAGLPGGGQGFQPAASASAAPPPPENGIGRHPTDDTSAQSGQFLLVLEGGSFADLLSDVRVGVHVIGFESGGSESFVGTPVPEPATGALLALGLAGVALARRRGAFGPLPR